MEAASRRGVEAAEAAARADGVQATERAVRDKDHEVVSARPSPGHNMPHSENPSSYEN